MCFLRQLFFVHQLCAHQKEHFLDFEERVYADFDCERFIEEDANCPVELCERDEHIMYRVVNRGDSCPKCTAEVESECNRATDVVSWFRANVPSLTEEQARAFQAEFFKWLWRNNRVTPRVCRRTRALEYHRGVWWTGKTALSRQQVEAYFRSQNLSDSEARTKAYRLMANGSYRQVAGMYQTYPVQLMNDPSWNQ